MNKCQHPALYHCKITDIAMSRTSIGNVLWYGKQTMQCWLFFSMFTTTQLRP